MDTPQSPDEQPCCLPRQNPAETLGWLGSKA